MEESRKIKDPMEMHGNLSRLAGGGKAVFPMTRRTRKVAVRYTVPYFTFEVATITNGKSV